MDDIVLVSLHLSSLLDPAYGAFFWSVGTVIQFIFAGDNQPN